MTTCQICNGMFKDIKSHYYNIHYRLYVDINYHRHLIFGQPANEHRYDLVKINEIVDGVEYRQERYWDSIDEITTSTGITRVMICVFTSRLGIHYTIKWIVENDNKNDSTYIIKHSNGARAIKSELFNNKLVVKTYNGALGAFHAKITNECSVRLNKWYGYINKGIIKVNAERIKTDDGYTIKESCEIVKPELMTDWYGWDIKERADFQLRH